MGKHVVRYEQNGQVSWGAVASDRIYPLATKYESLKSFFEDGGVEELKNLALEGPGISVNDVKVLSPVTRPTRLLCQGANYGSHREEGGISGEKPAYNLIFRKEDSSIIGTNEDVICPPHVKLLDYELELGLVVGKALSEPKEFKTDEELYPYIQGLVITNDISARDIQMLQGQWYKSKSYRTFTPIGPYLYVLDADEMGYLHNLDIQLSVNDEVRQDSNTSYLLYKPTETLTELSQMVDIDAGDVILTGTTGGVAMKGNRDLFQKVSDFAIPYEERLEALIASQNQDMFLDDNDSVTLTIKSPDGRIDLGVLTNKVKKRVEIKTQ